MGRTSHDKENYNRREIKAVLQELSHGSAHDLDYQSLELERFGKVPQHDSEQLSDVTRAGNARAVARARELSHRKCPSLEVKQLTPVEVNGEVILTEATFSRRQRFGFRYQKKVLMSKPIKFDAADETPDPAADT